MPTAPRALQLTQTQDDPPVIAVTWQPPRTAHGRLSGYKLTYGIRADSYVEERRFDADKLRFTTGFLGQLLPNLDPGSRKSLVLRRPRNDRLSCSDACARLYSHDNKHYCDPAFNVSSTVKMTQYRLRSCDC